ncbi:MAG: hypothetical protein LBJ43_00885 [Propionibacteriaceae bacterium]|jgi:hypothetical protein|nr:hypothetical protein [Propionibacteriaceae bacterium]
MVDMTSVVTFRIRKQVDMSSKPTAAGRMSPFGNPNLSALRPVASYDNYADAERAVDYLADAEFPVETLTIVGAGLRSFEKVTGRLSWARVILSGVLSGVLWGLMLAVLFWLLLPGKSMPYVFGLGTLAGVVYGTLANIVSYATTRGERDFTSVHSVAATRYEVLSDVTHAAQARAVLSGEDTPEAMRVSASRRAL